MLDTVNLANRTDKAEYKAQIKPLERRLGELQRQARDAGAPVIIVFEGWDAAGKGTLINRLLLAMDPRGYKVASTTAPNEEQRLRPFLWRFWLNTPARGQVTVFDRSWYGRVLDERVAGLVKKPVWRRAYDEIGAFERQLAQDGAVIVKFFLHIAPDEQKKRFKALEKNPAMAWKVTKDDWRRHRKYKHLRRAVEDMIVETDASHAPWTIVAAHDRRFATLKVFSVVIEAMERKLQALAPGQEELSSAARAAAPEEEESVADGVPEAVSILDELDLSQSLAKSEYKKELKRLQKRLRDLEHEAYVRRLPVVIVCEGSDAAGKGGAIRRLVQGMDPRGYDVIPIGAPNDMEKARHYLWRFWRACPKAGHIAIFDRSWYGRVLVERVEGFCEEAEWRRAYREINEMEGQWVDAGVALAKFWYQISKDEQLRRFEARQQTPHKRWKITEEDWRNREKWDAYRDAADEMLRRASTPYAPWTIVEAEDKRFSRIKTLRTVVAVMERGLGLAE